MPKRKRGGRGGRRGRGGWKKNSKRRVDFNSHHGRGGRGKRKGNFGNRKGFKRRKLDPEVWKKNYTQLKDSKVDPLKEYQEGIESDKDLGIELHMTPDLPEMKATIKNRFSDFIVQEVDKEGNVLEITNQDIEPSELKESSQLDLNEGEEAIEPLVGSVSADFKAWVAKGKAKSKPFFFNMIKKGDTCETKLGSAEALEVFSDRVKVNLGDWATAYIAHEGVWLGKEDREIKKQERGLLHKALNEHFPMIIHETSKDPNKQGIICKFKSGTKVQWPRHRPNFLRFVMAKQGHATMSALNNIANKFYFKFGMKRFGFAGNKDQRAVTTQFITAKFLTSKDLQRALTRVDTIKAGNFSFVNEAIALGQLGGNRFTVVLRAIKATDEEITARLEQVKKTGFINYFGTQRFGTYSVPTHIIGLNIVQKKWTKAAAYILLPRKENYQNDKRRRQALERGRPGEFGRNPTAFRLMSHLCYHKNDFQGAMMAVDRPMRNLYVHALQSFVWNKVVTERVREHGTTVLAGDLVQKEGGEEFEVRAITAEEVAGTSVYDILMPMPGSETTYPDNAMAELYTAELKALGIEKEVFKELHQKDFNIKGSYRKMCIKAKNVTYSIHHYDDPRLPLVDTPFEKASGEVEGGKYKATVLSFQLPVSAYATMFLREALRGETNVISLKRWGHDGKKKDADEPKPDTGVKQEEQTKADEAQEPTEVKKDEETEAGEPKTAEVKKEDKTEAGEPKTAEVKKEDKPEAGEPKPAEVKKETKTAT